MGIKVLATPITSITFTCKGDAGKAMLNLIEHIKDKAADGCGIDIVVETGDGKETFFIDGDGADKIADISFE